MNTYNNTKSAKLINENGLDHIKGLWSEYGRHRAAKILGTTPWVIKHIVEKYGWKRPVSKAPNIKIAVEDGSMKQDDYKHLDFTC